MTDPLYVLARRALLDGIEALGEHRDAVVLVGAQAIYLQVGEADLAVAPYTTDADLIVDPARLGPRPPLEAALRAAGFEAREAGVSVGQWVATVWLPDGLEAEAAIDLMVPVGVSPKPKGRAAALAGHDPRAARNVTGLEGALVDFEPRTVGALAPGDPRSVQLRVAGPAALLVAKVHKIADRQGTHRQGDKDALDVLRLLRGRSTEALAAGLRRMLADTRSTACARRGIELLQAQFGSADAVGTVMAVRAAGLLADPDEIAASCTLLAADLLGALASG